MKSANRLRTFYRENGMLLTLIALLRSIWRRAFSAGVSRALPGRPAVNVDPSSRLLGLKHVRIGKGFRAGRRLWLEAVTQDGVHAFTPEIRIGDNVIINDDVHIAAIEKVQIGNDVLLASKIFISDHNHGDYGSDSASSPTTPPRLRPVVSKGPVIIEDGVWVGEMVSILPGVTVGRGSVIGCNSVVSRSIPSFSIAMGCPAQVVRRFSEADGGWRRVER